MIRFSVEWWKSVAEIAGIGAAVFGVLIGYFEYSERQDENRIAETLKYAQRFQSNPVYDAKIKLSRAWVNAAPAMNELLSRAVSTREEEEKLQNDFSDFILKTVSTKNLHEYIWIITDFFGAVGVCVKSSICDGPTAKNYFGAYARVFKNLHRPYIEGLKIRMGNVSLDEGLNLISN